MADTYFRVGDVLPLRLSNSLYERDFAMSDLKQRDDKPSVPFVGTAYTVGMVIEHVFLPSTLSVVMKVRYHDPINQREKKAILKLFDRRFMASAREHMHLTPWKPSVESQYCEIVQAGKAKMLMRRWIADDHGENMTEHDLDQQAQAESASKTDRQSGADSTYGSMSNPGDGQNYSNSLKMYSYVQTLKTQDQDVEKSEATDKKVASSPREISADSECWLQYMALQMFERETKSYRLLSHLQGKCIPKLLGLSLVLPSSQDESSPKLVQTHRGQNSQDSGIVITDPTWEYHDPLLAVPGLLLEYIEDTFTISELQSHVPRADWRSVIEKVTAVKHTVAQSAFIANDVNDRNVLVYRNDQGGHYECMVIDFAIGIFRFAEDSDRKWSERKSNSDEVRYLYDEVAMKLESDDNPEDELPQFEYTQWDTWYQLWEAFEKSDCDWEWELRARQAEAEDKEWQLLEETYPLQHLEEAYQLQHVFLFPRVNTMEKPNCVGEWELRARQAEAEDKKRQLVENACGLQHVFLFPRVNEMQDDREGE